MKLRRIPRSLRHFSTDPRRAAAHPFRFHVGASWAGKPADDLARRARARHPGFASDTPLGAWRDAMLARSKAVQSVHAGQDFYFVQEMRGASGVALGVADGVGGWVSAGVDPSKFSQALMYYCSRYARAAWAGEPPNDPTTDDGADPVEGWELTPAECIELAHGAVLRERSVDAGSSTACVLTLNAESGFLRAANLGDSGFVIIRSNAIVYHQPPQTRFFNCPRQLAKLPAGSDREGFVFSDSPRIADRYSTSLRSGDVVILYTDGVADNVFESELVSICALVARAADAPDAARAQAIADRVIEYACTCMWMKTRPSPFERAAARADKYWSGGKPDDATAVVAVVTEGI